MMKESDILRMLKHVGFQAGATKIRNDKSFTYGPGNSGSSPGRRAVIKVRR